ncbi:MAG: slipin family protein [Eggerthellaceae bacterium]|nr:slipin family protein [Eggerthellaceae bacterium]
MVTEASELGRIDAGAITESGERASSLGLFLFSTLVFVVVLGAAAGGMYAVSGQFSLLTALASFAAAVLVTMSVHVAQQWERVVVLRLGKVNRVCGPGLFWTIPFFESNTIRVDCRTRSTTFGAEETLSADLVPLTVNAVLLWMVYDAKAACTEVADFSRTVQLVAQAALRDAIGRLTATEVAIRREQLDEDLKQTLEEEASQWGISILQVKVRDILIPAGLQNVMSLEAQAEQRRKARLTLMETEQDISSMIEDAAAVYGSPDATLKLRQMLLLSEVVQETGSAVVVPSSFSEGFGDIFGGEAKVVLGN